MAQQNTKKAELFCAPIYKAGANTKNHNHRIYKLPLFLMSRNGRQFHRLRSIDFLAIDGWLSSGDLLACCSLFHCAKSLFPGGKRVHAGLVRNTSSSRATWQPGESDGVKAASNCLAAGRMASISTRRPTGRMHHRLDGLVASEVRPSVELLDSLGLNSSWLINTVDNDAGKALAHTKPSSRAAPAQAA